MRPAHSYLDTILDTARDRHQDADRLLLDRYEPIAIVGIGLKFPGGCESLDDFDAFLREGRSGIRPIPEDRWDVAAFTPDPDHPDERGKIRTSGGGFLDRVDLFDAPFFKISPKEAQYIDPQQRMVLETAWQALEHARLDPAALRGGNGSVYIGASSIDYALELDALPYEELDGHLAAGITMFPLSGRLSYFLGWRGPSVSVDTACSSSLAALHMAVQALRGGETDLALCGGVNALHHPRIPVMFSDANMLAPDGRCKTFDDSADGYARAEGCGVIVLKRLSDATRDGDEVLALVRGTAVGQDGQSAGLTAPNGPAQERVLRAALRAALLEPGDIQYVEAHGTGTPLGDPIELGAINDVFGASHTKEEPLVVGSAKTNLGHMEPASGIVGVVKSVLQIRSSTIYPHLNFTTPSGRIPWQLYPVRVPTACEPWKAPTRRAVVNSFGFAGTIAAAVLEEPPQPLPTPAPAPGTAPPAVLTLSAASPAALRGQIERYRAHLAARPQTDPDAFCATANLGRSHLPYRIAAPVADSAQLRAFLDREAERPDREAPAGARKVAFLFSGQGAQYPGMAAGLYARFPVFREQVDACEALFAPALGRSVRDLLLGTAADGEEIHRTRCTQPALFTLEYALARLWMSWGVTPLALIGHSIGEVVAATVAGVFSLPDAVTLVAARGRLMQSVTAAGGMVAVSAPAEEVLPLLAGRADLALAAVNAPDQCVVSGARAPLAEVVAELGERGVRTEALTVSHAFHSPLMREVFDDFRAAIEHIEFHDPSLTLLSNVTGRRVRRGEVDNPDYWVRHIGAPVRFLDAVRTLAARKRHAFVEIGPSSALTALAQRCLDPADHVWLTSLSRRGDGVSTLLRNLAAYYTAGLTVDWKGYHGTRPALTDIPTYAFHRKRHWLPVKAAALRGTGTGPAHHPVLGTEMTDGEQAPGVREFSCALVAADTPPLLAHRTPDGSVLPAAALVDALLALQDTVHGHPAGGVRDLRLHRPVPLPEDEAVTLRTRLTPVAGGYAVEITSDGDGQRVRHADAVLPSRAGTKPVTAGGWAAADAAGGWSAADAAGGWAATDAAGGRSATDTAGGLERVGAERIGADDLYDDLVGAGVDVAASYRVVRELVRHPGGAARAELSGGRLSLVEHLPAEILEGALTALAAHDADGPALTLASARSVRLVRKPRGDRLTVLLRPGTPDGTDLLLLDGDAPVAELLGVRLAPVQPPAERRRLTHRTRWLRRAAAPAAVARPRHALVVHGADDAYEALASAARLAGHRVGRVTGADELAQALRDRSVTDVCWLWRPAGGAMSAGRLRRESELNYRDLPALVTALGRAPGAPRLWLVTAGAQWLPGDPPGPAGALAAATLWGFGPVVLAEYPRLRATVVDLGPGEGPGGLLAEWAADGGDDHRIAYRGGVRHVQRLLAGDTTPAWDGDFAVHASADGTGAAVRPAGPAPAPADGEVRIAVSAAAVTARDARPPCAGEEDPDGAHGPVLGSAAAGTVTAAGAASGFAVGDRVLVRAGGTLRSTVTVPADAVSPLADGTDPVRAVASGGAPLAVLGLDEADEALALLADMPADAAVVVRTTGGADPEPAAAGTARRPPVRIRPDRTYLVTGGLGGLGLATAQWLADRGARHIALLGRTGRAAPESREALARLSRRAQVTILRGDVGDAGDVGRITGELLAADHPVGGVVHAAGALGAALIPQLDWAAIDGQFAAKVYGGWLLHEASAAFEELDFFVCYSSISSMMVVPNATHAHYAASSAFLDALAGWRARRGLPALAVNWGAWSRVGMSARLDDRLVEEVRRGGLFHLTPTRALRALGELLERPVVQRMVGDVDWGRFTATTPVPDALYERLARAGAATGDAGGPALDLDALLAEERPRRLALITDVVADRVAATLHMAADDELDRSAEFVSLGLDSLMAVTVRGALEAVFRVPLPASLAFDFPSVRHLSAHLDALLVPAPDQTA
ncbi:SDR family oxidoreductase [Streptomyces sp. SL13]|uniref:SDR family oxidoreductase n=1 Tax=Streptantibioticus silvisoli TaxID=2705255 RepID=A0AA90KC02_9ACTN|nr:type I polyketide synthase [Streptantibioticus silvisoli]MDI5974353.1 SDR family oxidoreductase [Streptantibioticus silvisoli]